MAESAPTTLPLAWRFAWRHLRADWSQGLAGFRLLLLCLALGVAAIAGIGSLAAAIDSGIKGNATALLGGDLEFSQPDRDMPPAEQTWLARQGRVSNIVQMPAMVRTGPGTRPVLVEVRAVDNAYPLVGAVEAHPDLPLGRALGKVSGVPGMLAAREVFDRLGLKPGDRIELGGAVFQLRGMLGTFPDAAPLTALGPPVLISLAELQATGLDGPGTLSSHAWRVLLPPGRNAHQVALAAAAAFPEAGWRIKEATRSAQALELPFDRAASVLTLVGLSVLVLGGLGAAQSVSAHLERRRRSASILRGLGASRGLIAAAFAIEFALLSFIGIAIGLLVGAAVPALAAFGAGDLRAFLDWRVLYPAPLLLASIFGIGTAAATAGTPLLRLAAAPVGELFRAVATPGASRGTSGGWIYLVSIPVLAGIAIAAAADRVLALYFIGGLLAAALLLLAAAWAAVAAIRAFSASRTAGYLGYGTRLALLDIARHRAQAIAQIVGQGLGLAVLVAVALVELNVANGIGALTAGATPSFFLIDIQPDELPALTATVAGISHVSDWRQMPNLRMRITAINDESVGKIEMTERTRQIAESDRGTSYGPNIPSGSRVVAGSWWPKDYQGPPLVSVDADLAHDLHVQVGDRMTVNISGREITARVASLRRIDWSGLGIDYFVLFAPGTLEAAPQTHIATLRAEGPAAESAVETAVADRFPNVTLIRVHDAIARMRSLLGILEKALDGIGMATMGAGLLVLAGIVAAGRGRRIRDAASLRLAGASRRLLLESLLIQQMVLAIVTCVGAPILGCAAAWQLLTRVLHVEFAWFPLVIIGIALTVVALTTLVAWITTWRDYTNSAVNQLRRAQMY